MNHFHSVTMNEVSFRLKELHDFSWLNEIGDVFCVFDEQDSGNICFGVERNGTKRFVKFAGAKTIAYKGRIEDAATRLKQSISVYQELRHESLVKLVDHFHVSSGYALVFEWFEGECLHSPGEFPPPKKYQHPESPYFRFKQLPIMQRIEAMSRIIEFHAFVEKKNFVAIDFYDGSILYDFKDNRTMICDFDLYKIGEKTTIFKECEG